MSKKVGRPRMCEELEKEIMRLWNETRKTKKEISVICKVHVNTVHNVVNRNT